jgi:pimeloyl-ACP methyl ester carboxylesterase
MRQFLLKNLGRDEAGKLFWRCHLAGIRDAYHELRGPVDLPVVQCPALFITGAKSEHVVPADEALIRSRFPHAEFRVIAGAGHWVHGEAPAEFVRVLEDWLKPGV